MQNKKNKKRKQISINDFEMINQINPEGRWFKVRHSETGLIQAMKIVDPEQLSGEEEQNRLYIKLDHPNILNYQYVFLENDKLHIVTEYVECKSLMSVIARIKGKSGKFNEEKVWKIVIQVLNGLKYLHNQNHFHANLKSSNILICSSGTVKLADMHRQKIIDQQYITVDNSSFNNKLAFNDSQVKPPEFWKDRIFDNKSDMWQLGVLIYEMCCLKPLFLRNKTLQQAICQNNYGSIPKSYSLELLSMYNQMVDKSPALRPSAKHILQSQIFTKKKEQLSIRQQQKDSPSKNNSPVKISQINSQNNITDQDKSYFSANYLKENFKSIKVQKMNIEDQLMKNLNEKKMLHSKIYEPSQISKSGIPKKNNYQKVGHFLEEYQTNKKKQFKDNQREFKNNSLKLPPVHSSSLTKLQQLQKVKSQKIKNEHQKSQQLLIENEKDEFHQLIEMQLQQQRIDKKSRYLQQIQQDSESQHKIKASNFKKPHESLLNHKYVNKSIHHTDNKEQNTLASIHQQKVRTLDKKRIFTKNQHKPLQIETTRDNFDLFIDNLRSTNTGIFQQSKNYY